MCDEFKNNFESNNIEELKLFLENMIIPFTEKSSEHK